MNLIIIVLGFIVSYHVLPLLYLKCFIVIIKKRDRNVVLPKRCDRIYTINNNSSGELMSYKKFKQGMLEKATKQELKTFYTVMLTGLYSYLIETCQKDYSNCSYDIVNSTSHFSTSFLIKLSFKDGNCLYLLRVMENPDLISRETLAAEDPLNYVLKVGFDVDDKELSEDLEQLIDSYCSENNLSFEKTVIPQN